MTRQSELRVVKNTENPEPDEVIAQAIIDLADAAKRFAASRLNRRAIVLILHDATKLSRREIEHLLEVLPRLEQMYLKR